MPPLISPHQLSSWLDQPETLIFDCRFDLADAKAGRQAWLTAHIPGAFFADLNQDLSDLTRTGHGRHPLPSVEKLRQFFAGHGLRADTRVALYDARDGMFAARAWWLLRWLGHDRSCVLDGGLAAWQQAGLPVSSVPPALSAASSGAHLTPRSGWVLESNQVQTALAQRALQLVDARAAPRFEGTVEPLDRVAGHVPGAVNLPFMENLNADGSFKSPAALRERWAALETPGHLPLAVMCGSGVTACHHLLARAHAGLPPALLYADSWSGWISDPSRAVATGA
jgi:thiosulfate/3-mercaptopyruvate sulfurtransferase